MKKVFALLITGVLAASMLAGCGGNSSSSDDKSSAVETTVAETKAPETTVAATTANDLISGKWVNGSFIVEGTEYSFEEYAEANGVTADSITINYEFNAEGKAICSWPFLEKTAEGTYTFDGKTLEANFTSEQGDSSVKFEYDAEKDTLSATDATSGVVTVMVRANGEVGDATSTTEAVEDATGEVGDAVVADDAEATEAEEAAE